MTFLICMRCPASCSLDTHDKPIRPMLCGQFPDGHLIAPDWMEPPEHKEYIDNVYCDQQGEPYKGLAEFIQTPLNNPIRPHNPEELRILKEERDNRFRLRTEK